MLTPSAALSPRASGFPKPIIIEPIVLNQLLTNQAEHNPNELGRERDREIGVSSRWV